VRQPENDAQDAVLKDLRSQSPSAKSDHYSIWDPEPRYSHLSEITPELKPHSWASGSRYRSSLVENVVKVGLRAFVYRSGLYVYARMCQAS